MTAPASLVAVARRLAFVRETEGPNRGAWVSMLQRFAGGREGDSWCADFVSFVLDVAHHGQPPVGRTGSCQALLTAGRALGAEVTDPAPEDLFLLVNEAGHAHHCGIVTAASPLAGIAGNTSPDGLSDNGTGVFEHPITAAPPRIAFLRLKQKESDE
ncbi:MAG: hypothetical protein V4597_08530 [Pseudomonadota bacterium]